MRKSNFIATVAFLAMLLTVTGCNKCCKSNSVADAGKDTTAMVKDSVVNIKLESKKFIKPIPGFYEKQYVAKYDSISKIHKEMTKEFTVDNKSFKDIISNNNFTYAKFFFIQNKDGEAMNIGLALSDNDGIDVSKGKSYELKNGSFTEDNSLTGKIGNFKKTADKIWGNSSKLTQYVVYKKDEIENYFNIYPDAKSLRFVMIYFGKVKENENSDRLVIIDPAKYQRMSFSVHANSSSIKVNPGDSGYDQGALKP